MSKKQKNVERMSKSKWKKQVKKKKVNRRKSKGGADK